VLPVEKYHTVEAISNLSNVDWRTCQKWLDIMEHIQTKQDGKNSWLIVVTLGENRGYARKRRRGE